MQKIFKIISVGILILLGFLFIIGIISSAETNITSSIVIERPSNLVWQKICDVNKMSDWRTNIAGPKLLNTEPLEKNSIIQYYWQNSNKPIIQEEKVVEFKPEKILSLRLAGDPEKMLILNMVVSFEIKPLLDGTTELTSNISYKSKSFLTRIYNQVIMRRNLSRDNELTLKNLKHIIERS